MGRGSQLQTGSLLGSRSRLTTSQPSSAKALPTEPVPDILAFHVGLAGEPDHGSEGRAAASELQVAQSALSEPPPLAAKSRAWLRLRAVGLGAVVHACADQKVKRRERYQVLFTVVNVGVQVNARMGVARRVTRTCWSRDSCSLPIFNGWWTLPTFSTCHTLPAVWCTIVRQGVKLRAWLQSPQHQPGSAKGECRSTLKATQACVAVGK